MTEFNCQELAEKLDGMTGDVNKIKELIESIYNDIYEFKDPDENDTIATDKVEKIRLLALSIVSTTQN